MQNFLSILDLDPDRIAKLLELAATLKRERVKGMKAPTAHALERQARRLAVREAVAAHARHLHDRRPRARRRHRRDPRRRDARRSRADQRRRPQSRALGRCGRDPHVRPGAAASDRRDHAEAARHQRAQQRGASVPGARRHADARRAVGIARRQAHRVRRRRQQRLHVARARGDDARHRACTSRRRKGSSCPDEVVDQAAEVSPEGRRAHRVHRSEGRGRATSTPSTPTCGRRWDRKSSTPSARRPSSATR